jgi:hypothetical protein
LVDLANTVTSSSSAAEDDDDDPFLPAGFVSARPSSHTHTEREREEGSEARVRWGLHRVDEDAGRMDKVEELSRHHGISGSRFSLKFYAAILIFTH